MSDNHAPSGADEGDRIAIRVQGHLSPRWSAWFDGLTVTTETDGTTVIHGTVPDQAALFGLLQKLRDVGLPLLAVDRTGPDDRPRPSDERP
jgi:hypothetical protein